MDPPVIDGLAALEAARSLSFPRFPGTEAESRARGWVREAMERLGYRVEELPFRYDSRSVERLRRLAPLFPVLIVGGFAWSAPRASPLAWLGVTGLLVLSLRFMSWPWLEALLHGEREGSANLLARRPAGPEGWGPRGERPLIYFVAHLDSKSQRIGIVGRGLIASLLAIATSAAWLQLGLRSFGFAPAERISIAWLLGLLVVCAAPLAANASGNLSPGALDDAAGCGVLVALARALSDRSNLPYEPVFTFTGAEEVGMVGASRLALTIAARPGRAGCSFINFDGPGAGSGLLGIRHGPGRGALTRAARRASSRSGVPLRFARLLPAAGVDGVPLGSRGIPGITLVSAALGRAVRAVHRPGDRPENLDPAALARAGRLALALAEELASVCRAAEESHRGGGSTATDEAAGGRRSERISPGSS